MAASPRLFRRLSVDQQRSALRFLASDDEATIDLGEDHEPAISASEVERLHGAVLNPFGLPHAHFGNAMAYTQGPLAGL